VHRLNRSSNNDRAGRGDRRGFFSSYLARRSEPLRLFLPHKTVVYKTCGFFASAAFSERRKPRWLIVEMMPTCHG
jgi:hypothetical protein